MTTVDFPPRGVSASYQPFQHPHRKPISASSNISPRNPIRQSIVPDTDFTATKQPQSQPTNAYSIYSSKYMQPLISSSPSNASNNAAPKASAQRRTLSQSTTSTGYIPSRTPSNVSSHLSRNASTRSGASSTPGSYVALMRKQKATVWCDRAQHEDPRLAAQQKAAKARAAREITGRAAEGRTSTSGSMGSGSLGVRSKIRHHGVPRATGYTYGNMSGGGVPLRLSANEVGDEEGTAGCDEDGVGGLSAPRPGSGGRNSGDARRLTVHNRYSQGESPGSGQSISPNERIPEMEETPVPETHEKASGYFDTNGGQGGSAGSSERENSFGNVGSMEAPKSEEKKRRTSEELRRRGSVDERANTMAYMGGGRLFVANPDLSD